MAHGIGMTGYRTKTEMRKWQVCYRCKDGGFGIVGYLPLFNTKKEALERGEEAKATHPYMKEIFVQHPSKMYSAY